jgi:hypothetical protein
MNIEVLDHLRCRRHELTYTSQIPSRTSTPTQEVFVSLIKLGFLVKSRPIMGLGVATGSTSITSLATTMVNLTSNSQTSPRLLEILKSKVLNFWPNCEGYINIIMTPLSSLLISSWLWTEVSSSYQSAHSIHYFTTRCSNPFQLPIDISSILRRRVCLNFILYNRLRRRRKKLMPCMRRRTIARTLRKGFSR